MKIAPFEISVDEAVLQDLCERLRRVRWSDAVAADWSYGTQQATLMRLVDHWGGAYDWRAREAELNRLPHFRAEIDGTAIHFLHARGQGPAPQPLLLMNGWPSSFVEYQALLPRLTDPARFGGDPADAFDVVIPAPPGYGFSDRPTRPGPSQAVELFQRLMAEGLGYSKFGVAGTDIGAGVGAQLALRFPERVRGLHVTSVVDPPDLASGPPLSAEEEAYQERRRIWSRDEGAYSALQRSKPQTLAYGLADSPVGLASWILEKFHGWSDCGGDVTRVFPMDMLIDNLMIYWVTGTIGSSVRYYYEHQHAPAAYQPGDRIEVPTAVLVLPKEISQPPREWAERLYRVHRYRRLDRGGHFPGWEVPDAYANDLRGFFGDLRREA